MDSNELFIDGLEVADDEVVGQVGRGFCHLLDSLTRAHLRGPRGRWYRSGGTRSGHGYANERVVFDRPIGQNQAVAHPLADSWIRLESAG